MAFKYLIAAVNLIVAIICVIAGLMGKENDIRIGFAVFAIAFFANMAAILMR